MFGIANYVFIVGGILLILGSLLNYKVFNPRIWGHYRKKKGAIGGISGFIYRFNIIRDYWNVLLGSFLIGLGIYGIIYDIHGKKDIGISELVHARSLNNKEEHDTK